jgi:hypothetical protein
MRSLTALAGEEGCLWEPEGIELEDRVDVMRMKEVRK